VHQHSPRALLGFPQGSPNAITWTGGMLLHTPEPEKRMVGGDWRGPRVDWRDLSRHAEGLVCLAGGPPAVGLLIWKGLSRGGAAARVVAGVRTWRR
jgi:hypothetical protein